MSKANVLWIDLEMTGLNPDETRIIEVGAIATDWNMNEIATYEQIVHQDQVVLDGADAWVKQNMKDLLNQVQDGKPQAEVEQELLAFIAEHFDTNEPIYLAGNSIHQDRRFIRRYMPKLEGKLHYRMLDVSAWKVVMSHKYDVQFKKRESHRALDDIRGSIEEMELYLGKIKL